MSSKSRIKAFSMNNNQERFKNFELQEEYDTYDPKEFSPSFLKKRSEIVEIVSTSDIVIVLVQSGVCAAFSRETNQRICFLNASPDDFIRSLFYNKHNDSLITVSLHASDHFQSLKCRSTKIEYIRRGKPDAGFALFESESLKWPGFFEFDDVNGKVFTCSVRQKTNQGRMEMVYTRTYKVFDLKNYTMLFVISDENIEEIKRSLGVLILIFRRAGDHLPVKILSIDDGTVMKTLTHILHPNKKLDFVELLSEKLLVKQENENMQMLDVTTAELTEVSKSEFMTPSFLLLFKKQLFLTIRNRTVVVWNIRGELVTSFEDHLLWNPDCHSDNIYVTSDEDHIISYCKADSDDPSEGSASSINISNILSGKCIAKISASTTINLKGDCSSSRIRKTVVKALEDTTALFYDEEHNEIYTGNRQGLVHVWSKGKNETMARRACL